MMISKGFFVIFKTAAPSGYWAFSKGFTWLKNSILNFILLNLNLTIHGWLLAVEPNKAVLKVNFQQIIYLKKISLKTQQNSQEITLSVQKKSLSGQTHRTAMICHHPVRQQEIRFNDNLIFSLPGFLSMFSFETITVLP